MITLYVDDCNPVSQEFYDQTIFNLQFHQLFCVCSSSARLSVHGYYTRGFKSGESTESIRICRVKCSHCGKTHALLLSSMVPYSQVSLADQAQIIGNDLRRQPFTGVMQRTPSISESNVRSIIRRFREFWQERLASERIQLSAPSALTIRCFLLFSRQFMQIKNKPNLLFGASTL